MQNVPCPYCNGTAVFYIAGRDLNQQVSEITFHLYRCEKCEIMFLIDPPADMGRYYPSTYHGDIRETSDLGPLLNKQKYKLEIVKKFVSSGTMLEIGPSIGVFSYLAKEGGFDVSAIEFDSYCTSFLNEKIGVRAINSGDPASVITTENRNYDVICFWHSAEHIPDAWVVLAQAAKHLNPNGIIVIAAPNPHSFQARLMKEKWMHFDFPRHVYQFPIGWIVSFAQKHGLRPELITTNDVESRLITKASWHSWFSHVTGLKSDNRMANRFVRYMGKISSLWEDKEGHGGAYTIILRKNN